jgi:hypothetical protein
MGLKSPDAPAYRTKCVREMFSTTRGGASAPTDRSSNAGAVTELVIAPPPPRNGCFRRFRSVPGTAMKGDTRVGYA